jgi:hypothetical protein
MRPAWEVLLLEGMLTLFDILMTENMASYGDLVSGCHEAHIMLSSVVFSNNKLDCAVQLKKPPCWNKKTILSLQCPSLPNPGCKDLEEERFGGGKEGKEH